MAETERKTRRVALMVFMEAEGVDELDAAYCAQLALQHTINGGMYRSTGYFGRDGDDLPAVGFVRPDGVEIIGKVVAVRDAATAIANGYVWMDVQSRAWRDIGLEAPDSE